MSKSTKKDRTYWINLYWAAAKGMDSQLMCSPAQHYSKEVADKEHRRNRLLFGDARRIGNKAHKVTFTEAADAI